MATLLTCYSEFIAKVVAFEATLRQGAVGGPPIRDAVDGALQEARAAVSRAGRTAAEEEAATFAVVAWADETLVHCPGSEWGRRIEPLQKQHFRTLNAGNEFFQRLAKLGADSAEVIEVYYTVLCLGFEGQYKLDPNGPAEIRNRREQLSLQLPTRPPRFDTLAVERAYPQPYGVADPGPVKVPFNWRPYILGAVAALLLLLIGGAVWYVLSRPPSVEQVEAAARAKLPGYACADMAVTVDGDRNARVTGYLSSAADKERLTAELKAMNGVDTVAMQAVVHIKPLCEALLLLKPHLKATDAGKAPSVAVNAKTGGTKIGNKLILDARAADSDGNVYIDLYDPEGNVLHMLPNLVNKATFRTGRNRFILGDVHEGGRVFDLLDPPGEHLVTVLSVSGTTPLFAKERPEVEPAADYLPALREALQAAGQRSAPLAVGAPLFLDVVK
jgi:type IV/VI secretion system ImpK/VasF family protein